MLDAYMYGMGLSNHILSTEYRGQSTRIDILCSSVFGGQIPRVVLLQTVDSKSVLVSANHTILISLCTWLGISIYYILNIFERPIASTAISWNKSMYSSFLFKSTETSARMYTTMYKTPLHRNNGLSLCSFTSCISELVMWWNAKRNPQHNLPVGRLSIKFECRAMHERKSRPVLKLTPSIIVYASKAF